MHDKLLSLKLVALTVAMFGFGFALVPLYDVFCDLTGLGGKSYDVIVTETSGTTNCSVTSSSVSLTVDAVPVGRFRAAEAGKDPRGDQGVIDVDLDRRRIDGARFGDRLRTQQQYINRQGKLRRFRSGDRFD